MRQDAGVDGDAQRISQMVWMIFLKVFDDKKAWNKIMKNGMKSDFSWNSSAKKYIDLYKTVLNNE